MTDEYTYISCFDCVIEDEIEALDNPGDKDYFVYRMINSRFGGLYIFFKLLSLPYFVVEYYMEDRRVKKFIKEYSAKYLALPI